MTPEGRKYALRRLSEAYDMAGLRRVWESLSVEYQHDEALREFKDTMKARLKE